MSKRLDSSILICPICKSSRLEINKNIICMDCNNKYEQHEGKYYFVKLEEGDIIDPLDKIKHFLKSFSVIYNFLIYLVSPVYTDRHLIKFINKHIEGKNIVALNLGSGSSNVSNNISNVDIFKYESVDLTCDISMLPLRDNSVDIILNVAVLEHVPNPEAVVNEINRVLKPNGLVYSFFPFMQGFHASPYDFSRRTFEGMKVLYKDFECIELRSSGGPTSGFLWAFQEWIAIVLSFGIKPLHSFIYILMMVITFPIKFLDIILIHHPMAKNLSSGFTYIGKKK
ncbi:class I SAM-dependent methyltransferase [Paenibacillus radicis (ex Xue et al. 2023)]|uniref:Class I SAM-dependent methyltransferase n=1 Tax=Paenibacillus radicis (ex Xue et al. 2023) TaxID=2972489 RepID=A0ABT1YTG4_9BACL|nr:class I SAM-dependent methyltransferase [Paenibacillus radicis (ex Xue et al. 2023)]MCR8635990.1 class I SAM-dependent methyltransferase [Paenibacillus radicis (ex Xue et al. 2023)]